MTDPKTIEAALAAIAAKGYALHNLFQLEDRSWRANIRDVSDHYYEFGDGATPTAALMAALEASPDARVQKPAKTSVFD